MKITVISAERQELALEPLITRNLALKLRKEAERS
jgi:hypothetical protein